MKKSIVLVGLIALFCMMFAATVVMAEDADKEGKVNLNTATKEQLVAIGIESVIADEILALRQENDEFVDIEELLDVDGVTPKMLRQFKEKIYIEEAAGCNC